MISIFIDKVEIPLKNIWYNKRNYISLYKEYAIILDLTKPEIIEFIENFTKRKINDEDLVKVAKSKDSELGSMGIIWSLIQYFEQKKNFGTEDKSKPYYMLNSVDKIYLENGSFLILGKVENKAWV